MKHFHPILFFAFLIFFSSQGIFAQKYELILKSKSIKNQPILDSITSVKTFEKKNKIYDEINRIIDRLKLNGYFTATLVEDSFKNNRFEGIIYMGKKTRFVFVNLNLEQRKLLKRRNNPDKILVEDINSYKKEISNILLEKGIPFSEIDFTDYNFNGTDLEVSLRIQSTKLRTIDKVIFRGYENFPKSFENNYLKIKGKPFFPELLTEIEKRMNTLSFAQTTRTPEILFKKDSTILYIYAKKKQSSNIDAMVNLNTNESNQIQFNGIVDLTLNNVLDYGENLQIYWNRVDEDRSEFKVNSSLPYLFTSKFSGRIQFDIFRQDSTFLNTNASLFITYPLKSNIDLGLKLSLNSSSEIENMQIDSDISEFSSNALGTFLEFNSRKLTFNNEPKLFTSINLDYINRSSNDKNTNQFKIGAKVLSNIEISKRSLIHVHHQTEFLLSKNYLTNELFRIGGINSVRSINEQSIFSTKYSFLNTEYRFFMSNNYINSVADLAWSENINGLSQLFYSFGLGYNFKKNNNLINLSYVVGARYGEVLQLNRARLLIKIVTFF